MNTRDPFAVARKCLDRIQVSPTSVLRRPTPSPADVPEQLYSHIMRFSTSYELPVGRGKAVDTRGILGHIVGDWALAGFLDYSSGTPLSVAPGINPQIHPTGGSNRVTVTSYDNWRATSGEGGFDPFRDLWWKKSAFQNQPTQVLETVLGNATRNNPKARSPWVLNENVNLAKDFIARERIRITLRFEAFNLFNRVRWGNPNSTFYGEYFRTGAQPGEYASTGAGCSKVPVLTIAIESIGNDTTHALDCAPDATEPFGRPTRLLSLARRGSRRRRVF